MCGLRARRRATMAFLKRYRAKEGCVMATETLHFFLQNVFFFSLTCDTKNIRSKTIKERMMRSCSSSSGVMTRARKRRIGERDVWDMIVKNDDICFQHILP